MPLPLIAVLRLAADRRFAPPGRARPALACGGLARDVSTAVGGPRIVHTSDPRLSGWPDVAAIDRGSLALPFAIADDLDGRVTRPLGAARDLGAIEVH